jgi:hypothetical protein
MNISKLKLQEALEKVKPGLADKASIEQATSFCFLNGRVVTYNDSISLSSPVEGLELTGAIEAEHLYKFLSKIKKDELELEIKGNELILTTGKAKAGLTLQSEITLPLDEELSKKGKWKDLPENFIKYLSFAVPSCSKELSKPVLTCVHVQGSTIEASDGYRITKCTLKDEMPVNTFLLPSTSALEVVKLQPTKISEGKGWVHFKTEEDTILSCRIFEGEFPEIDAHLVVEGVRLELPNTIDEVLDRAMVFAKRDKVLSESVDISLSKRKLKISAKSDEGWFEESVNIKYENEDVKFSITPYLLKGILSETQECVLGKNKLKFQGENWEYITLLRGK